MATYSDNEPVVAKAVAQKAALGFYESSVLIPLVDTSFNKDFDGKVGYARKGMTIDVPKPAQFISTRNDRVMTDVNTQAIIEESVAVTLSETIGIYTSIDTQQAKYEIAHSGSEYNDRVSKSAGANVSATVEEDIFKEMGMYAQNTVVLPAITDAAVVRAAYIKANNMITKKSCPTGARYSCVDTDVQSVLAESVLSFFHSGKEIEKAFNKGLVTKFFGMEWFATENQVTRTNGGGGLSTTVSAYVDGSDTITLADATGIVAGDKLEFNVLSINQVTKSPNTMKIQRAVLGITGSVITIDPIYSADKVGRQNANLADGTVIIGKAVTVLGIAGKSYLCTTVHNKSAVALVTGEMAMPKNVEVGYTQKVMGVNMRFIQDYDSKADAFAGRLETLCGTKLIRPEWVAVVEIQLD